MVPPEILLSLVVVAAILGLAAAGIFHVATSGRGRPLFKAALMVSIVAAAAIVIAVMLYVVQPPWD